MIRSASSPARRRFLVCLAALIGLAPLAARGQDATPVTATPPPDAPVAVVAAGLTNPRGFAFGPDGTLAVALAGTGVPDAGVALVAAGCPVVVAGGLPSYRIVFNSPTGVADVAHLDGRRYALLSGGDIDRGDTPNGLYRLDDGGGVELIANISAFIRDNPVAEKPGDFDTDGQPYALLPMGDAFWATEGNSNQLLRLGLDGTVTRVADLSRGHPIPTGIAPAPDGGAYVALFTHAPYEDGAAKVVRVAPDGAVVDAWTGLTLPTALAVGPDGALYVASPAFGADDGQGTILRLDLSAAQPIAVPSDLPAPSCPAEGS